MGNKDGLKRDIWKVRLALRVLKKNKAMREHTDRLKNAGLKDLGHATVNWLVEGARREPYAIVHILVWSNLATLVGLLVSLGFHLA